ncbi:MAG: glycosyltransferase [Lachnospiraceae bacterium]|nr:glycosyltransferase [Lachnospiraceae bacterium]
MNILYYCWNENSAADIEQAFSNAGFSFVKVTYRPNSYDADPILEQQIDDLLHQYKFDCIYTFNYVPILSEIAQKYRIPYIAWIYDCPNLTIYSHTVTNACNYLFLFDRAMYRKTCSLGAKHAFHMPLAVQTNRLNLQLNLSGQIPAADTYSYDISFVGSLYENNLYDQIRYLPDRLHGYFDGAMRAQQEVWGYHFLEELIGDDLLKETLSYIQLEENLAYAFSPRQIIINMLDQKITSDERIRLLQKTAQTYTLDLFSGSHCNIIQNCRVHGAISYTDEMPFVFRNSKINLNISLRSITSGIPLRCLDVMGAGGFLLSNYQPELAEYFVPGEDFIYFESDEDMLAKIDYFLVHEKERKEIAENGWGKIQSGFSYEKKLGDIFSVIDFHL